MWTTVARVGRYISFVQRARWNGDAFSRQLGRISRLPAAVCTVYLALGRWRSCKCYPYATHEGIWGSGGIAPLILTLSLGRGEWSVSRPGRFTPVGRVPASHLIRGWVGPRVGLNFSAEEKTCCSSRRSNRQPSVVQPVRSHCTDWAIWAAVTSHTCCSVLTEKCRVIPVIFTFVYAL
jgi:hypothetical protein